MIYKWREKKAKLEGQEYQNKLVFTLGGGGGGGGMKFGTMQKSLN